MPARKTKVLSAADRERERQTDAGAKLARDSRPPKDADPGEVRFILGTETRADREALIAALNRADKLIDWMSGYIGRMAPLDYGDCYSDLNEHGLFMQRNGNRVVTRMAKREKQ